MSIPTAAPAIPPASASRARAVHAAGGPRRARQPSQPNPATSATQNVASTIAFSGKRSMRSGGASIAAHS
jgi:hypothetical protein